MKSSILAISSCCLSYVRRCQQAAVRLTAGKLFDLLLKRTLGETESFEDALDAVVKVVGVVMLKLVLDVLEAMFQPLALRLVGFGGDGVGDFFGMAGQIS